MIRSAAFSTLALITFALPNAFTGTSHASNACPCFTAEEIVATCPRPDAEHTEVFDTGGDGRSMILKCLATQNYSPGSIMFEAGPGGNGSGAYCGRQSVEVEPYGSGGQFPQISADDYAGCKAILTEAAEELELKLVMDQFSKKEILSGSYRDYAAARAKAQSLEDITEYLSSGTLKEMQDMPADLQEMLFEISREMAGPLMGAEIISESIDDDQAVVVAEYCSPENTIGTHTAWYIVENGGWKIRKEYNSVGSESCGDNGGDAQVANSCTDEEWNKSSARMNELLAAYPADQQDNLYNEAIDATINKLGNDFCSQASNECACNDEANKYLETK